MSGDQEGDWDGWAKPMVMDDGRREPTLHEEIARLRQVCRNVYEVWAGSEGIPVPETCAEGYLLQLVERMRDEAKEGLR